MAIQLPVKKMSIVLPEHLMVFGGIMHGFSRIDGQSISTITAVSDTDIVKINIITRPLSYE